jgi:1-acyl-sn-glycerol-3-phosphate acyltransferase
MRAVASLLVWAAWTVLVILWTPVVAISLAFTGWWDRSRWIAGRVFRFGARLLVALNPFWSVRLEGRVPARSAHPFVAVSNHESLADIILIGTLPWDMKWLSKSSIFRIPFLGLMMRMAGDVSVRREDRTSRSASLTAMGRWLARGSSVMIFPEGTRSRTEEMLPFRDGAFRLAIETGRPVQPLAVNGTRTAIRKGSLLFGTARVVVRILEPVATEGLGPGDVEELRLRVRQRIEDARQRPDSEAESSY